MTKQITLIFIFLLCGLFSQHNHGGGRGQHSFSGGIISGIILDSLSQKPIEYASISLVNQKDNTIETGGVTSESGHFDITKIKPGKYNLKIEFMGYKSKIIKNKNISPKNGLFKHDIGAILLNPALLQMDAVNVVEDKPIFEFETDKMIYNASDDIISDSGTAEDVLNKVPMVTVDQDGAVSLRGNGNVKILINGRPNRTGDGPNSVDNIPASLIEKVEVITSPSAKYDPDGMAGIINIVMKKGKYEGLNGSLKINGKYNEFNSLDKMNGLTAYGNYKTEKWNLFSSFNLNNRVRTVSGHRNVDTYYLDTLNNLEIINIESIHYTTESNSERPSNSLTFGADYYANESLEFNGEFRYSKDSKSSYENKLYTQPDANTVTTQNGDFGDNYSINGNFGFIKTFDNPDQKLTFLIDNNKKLDSSYVELLHSDYNDRTILSSNINLSEIKLSYHHPFENENSFEIGYDGRFDDNAEYMNFEFTNSKNSNLESFSGMNDFIYKRNINAIFAEYDYKVSESLSIKPSIRVEQVNKNISFTSNITEDNDSIIFAQILNSIGEKDIEDDYRNIYPDLHFTYLLNEKQSVQFGLSKRVNRPGAGGHGRGSRSIRPFPRDIYSGSFIFIGNPYLKPEYSTQYDVSYKTPVPMGFGYVNLFYHQLKNIIEWVDDDSFENADVLTFKNAESGSTVGFELFTMIMGQTIGGGYNMTQMDDSTGDYELNGNKTHMNIFSRINLPEKFIKFFDFEFGFYYMKIGVPGGSLFGNKGTLWANSGISKSFIDDKLSLSLSINNLFDSGGFQLDIKEKPLFDSGGNQYAYENTNVNMSRHPRTITFNIKYHFGKMQEEKRSSRGGRNGGGEMEMGF